VTAPTTPWPARRHLATGFLGLFLLVFCLGGWAAFTRISGAVIAPGVLEVEGNRQVVQHPTGGVVEAILVRDGDPVDEGAVLLRLDGERPRSDLAVVEGQFYELLARKDRLVAERDDRAAITFHPELLARAERLPDAAELVAAQAQEFQAQRRSLAEEQAQLRERIAKIGRQIEGLEAQRPATDDVKAGDEVEPGSLVVAGQVADLEADVVEAGIAGSGRGVADRTCGEVVAGEPAARVAPRRAIAIAPSPGRKTGCLRSKA
jgi:multidrug efflux pump subunit AcrA (membrane-fusion protein)